MKQEHIFFRITKGLFYAITKTCKSVYDGIQQGIDKKGKRK